MWGTREKVLTCTSPIRHERIAINTKIEPDAFLREKERQEGTFVLRASLLRPKLTSVLPLHEQFAKALLRWRLLVFLPDEDERHGHRWLEESEVERLLGGEHTFSHNAHSGASLGIAEHGANETRCVRESWRKTGRAASGEHGVVQAHTFPASEHNE
jgi:hypothetical protein